MKFGEFWASLAVTVPAVAAVWLMTPSMHPLFMAGLFALSFTGFFALAALYKAGFTTPNAEYSLIGCSFGCLFIAGLSAATLGYSLSFAFLPLIFSIPSLLSLSRNFVAKISG